MDTSKLKYLLSETNKKKILSLLYRKKLRSGEKVIDNSDRVISEELGLPLFSVGQFLRVQQREKMRRIDKKINLEK